MTGQVAVVTGASSGIGAGVALCLSNAGAMVALAARRVEKLETLKSQITEQGGTSIVVQTDVTDRKQVAELIKHTETTLGPVNILVNNAGIMFYSYMKNLKEDEWEKQIDLNIKGAMNCIGAVLGGMVERGKGHIVNMSSNAGRRGFAGLAVYSGTKFFIEGMSQGMRVELAKSGVKVTCIQPGDVESEIYKSTTDEEARKDFDGSKNNKILVPSDIGNAVVYAVTQPEYAAVNEILIEPREAPI